MYNHDGESNQHRRYDIPERSGEQKHNESQNRQNNQDRPIIDQAMEDHQRLVTEKVKVEPENDECGEDDERDRVPEETEEEDE